MRNKCNCAGFKTVDSISLRFLIYATNILQKTVKKAAQAAFFDFFFLFLQINIKIFRMKFVHTENFIRL